MPGTPYNGIGRTQFISKYPSNKNSGSLGTATTRLTGGLSSINELFKAGNVLKSCAKCHESSGVAALLLNAPVIILGL